MTTDPGHAPTSTLHVLELLARGAPRRQFEELRRRARGDGTGTAAPDELDELDRAVGLALGVHELLDRGQQREAGLTALVDTARDLTRAYDQDALLKEITRRARRLLHCDMAYIGFHEPEEDAFSIHTSDGDTAALDVGLRVGGGAGLAAAVLREGVPFWTQDYLADERIRHAGDIDAVVRSEGIRALVAVPLWDRRGVLGALYVAHRELRRFSPHEISLLRSLADLAAVAIEKALALEDTRAEVVQLEQHTSEALTSLTRERHLEAAQSALTAMVLAGDPLSAVVEEAARRLGGTLVARDTGGGILATSGRAPALADAVLRAGALDAHTEGAPVALGGAAWLAPLAAGRENLGTLLLVTGDVGVGMGVDVRRDRLVHTRLLHLAAQTVSLALLMERSTAIAEGRTRDEFFDELLAADAETVGRLEERARRLAIDLDGPHVVVVVRPEGGPRGRAEVWASSYARRTSGLKSLRHDGMFALLVPGEDPEAAARRVSGELGPLLGHPVTIGAAGPTEGVRTIRQVHREARQCLDALVELGDIGATATPRQMGFLGVLLSDAYSVGDYIDTVVGPVLDYDAQRFTELTRTLDAYFASGGSPTRAATALHVHPNTVSRRLERITELLGADWQQPHRALEIHLALRLHGARGSLERSRDPEGQAGSFLTPVVP
ncbi:helix-turn-helix domain-containing protein [Streptomyces sp. UNOC14_S4]|uniref:helix-turn-helix domain-containing protein n=1 Tax=Streptomyces sp. UNOC14_S4 TaxID=2872340 RepID=UPI001E502168|nr:helix-turn-helix domain-containing protein [Streptomyces sp. UNOC14_S4]MCC3772776.1 helix-turn-helix domain-containing protein [Streptomyces sp. UNOC14_S4]